MKLLTTPAYAVALIALLLATSSPAQESNVLGLPAIPQPKPGSTPPAGASKPLPSSSAAKGNAPTASVNRDAIAGELGLQHSAIDGVGRIVVTTRSVFATAGARSSALDTAKLVQKELAQACGKQCKPSALPAPKILSGGQLEFTLVFAPLYQQLNQTQFLAALQGAPMNLTAAQLQAPSTASAPAAIASPSTNANISTTTK